jgi:hypothetical protein
VILQLDTKVGAQLSGSLTRQAAEQLPVEAGHMVNIGSMIEHMEGKLRNSLDQVQLRRPRSERTSRSNASVMQSTDNSWRMRWRCATTQVYFQKTREVLSAVRLPVDDTLRADSKQALHMQARVISEMLRKQNKANVAIKPSDLGC